MYKRNWSIINAKRKDRWNAMDESGKRHMLEEQELNKKAKVLISLAERKGENYILKLKGLEMEFSSVMRMIEWGLGVQWNIFVALKRYPGIRFDKQEGCGPILEETQTVKVKLGLVDPKEEKANQEIKYATELLEKNSPEIAAALKILLAAKGNNVT